MAFDSISNISYNIEEASPINYNREAFKNNVENASKQLKLISFQDIFSPDSLKPSKNEKKFMINQRKLEHEADNILDFQLNERNIHEIKEKTNKFNKDKGNMFNNNKKLVNLMNNSVDRLSNTSFAGEKLSESEIMENILKNQIIDMNNSYKIENSAEKQHEINEISERKNEAEIIENKGNSDKLFKNENNAYPIISLVKFIKKDEKFK